MASIGLVGLGNAGRPMAERILAKGHSPTVFDIDRGALDRVVQRGARQAHSAGAAVSDITITLLPSSVEVRQAVLGENGVLRLTFGRHRRYDGTIRIARSSRSSSAERKPTRPPHFPERSGANGYLFARAVDAEGVQDRDQSYTRRRIILSPQKFVLGSRLKAPIRSCFSNSCRLPALKLPRSAWKSS